jgi:hypothetical protein
MFDLLVFIIVVIVITGAVLENIRLKNKNIELLFLLAQLNLDNDAIKKKLSTSEDVEKDHLIKFLSETRDASYVFIQEFQDEIKNLKQDLDNDVQHFEKFGVLAEPYDIHYSMSKKFVEYYRKLLKFLPVEDKD